MAIGLPNIGDMINRLRMSGIFGNMGPIQAGPYNPMADNPMQTPPLTGDMGGYDPEARMRQLFNPEHQAIDKMNDMIGQYPTYKEPGKLRNIGAIALGTLGDMFGPKGSGNTAFEGFTGRTKFNNDVENWKTQITPINSAATQERLNNTQQRQAATDIIKGEMQTRKDDATAKNNADKLKISQQRANVYEFKAKNPGIQFDFTGPYVMFKDPSGKAGIYKDDEGNPVETGKLSDKDKLDLSQKNALERIDATGNNQQQLEGMRQSGRQDVQDQRAWSIGNITDPTTGQTKSVRINSITGEIRELDTKGGVISKPSTKPTGGAETPTQTRVRQFNAARELYNSDALLRPFIKVGSPGTSDFEVTPPGTNFFGRPTGPTPDQYQAIVNAIYGAKNAQTTNIPPPNPQNTTTTNTGKVTREQAIQFLNANKQKVTPANIDYIMKNGTGGN